MSQQGEIKEKGDKIRKVMLQKQGKGVYFKNGVINGIKFSLEHKKEKGLKWITMGVTADVARVEVEVAL